MTGKLEIKQLSGYSESAAHELGMLMQTLTEAAQPNLITEDRMMAIIGSADRALLIAELRGRFVGAAVLNLIVGLTGTKVWLDEFVVSEEDSVRGQGVGYALWQEMLAWSREHDATSLQFTSKPSREAAQNFYKRQGATVRNTVPFRVDL